MWFTTLSILWVALTDLALTGAPEWLIRYPVAHTVKGVVYAVTAGSCLYLLFRRASARRLLSEGRPAEDDQNAFSLFQESHAAMLLLDPATGAIIDANAGAVAFYGYPVERLRSMRNNELVVESIDEPSAGTVPPDASGRRIFRAPHRLADGSIRDVVAHIGPVTLGSRRLLCSIVHDITVETRERRLADLMREVDEQLLAGASLDQIVAPLCRRIAAVCRLNLAWVAFKQPDGSVSVHGAGGPSLEYVERITVRWDDTPEGRGPIGRALRTGKPQLSMADHPDFSAWSMEATRYGIRACTSLPMLVGQEPVGALNLYAAHEAMFNEDTLAALQALTARLSLVFLNMRTQLRMRLQVAAMQSAANGILITDAKGRIEWVNDSFTAMTGDTLSDVLGATPALLKSGQHDPRYYAGLWSTIRSGQPWRGEVINRRKNGTLITIAETITPIRGEDGQIAHFVAIHEDVTARRRAEERSAYLSGHDPLTNLPNRALFHDRLSQAIRRSNHTDRPVGLIAIDLDNFKEINDSHGHDVGDLLLQEVAHRILGILGVTDTAARIGSDEFGVIVSDLPSADRLAAVAANFAAVVGGIERLGRFSVRVSSSIGAAVYPGYASSEEDLVRCAEMALALAKGVGAGEARFYLRQMGEELAAKVTLRNALANAIDNGQFRLLYQPQVDASTGRVLGAEALLRWESPEQGTISPGVFMAVAEESGLIVRIGDWVIEEVCRQIAAWRAAGLTGFRVAINLSAVQLQAGRLPERMAELMRRHEVTGESLEAELTETLLLTEAEDVVRQLQELNAMGIELALDDFGTGYSSLSYLRRFPIRKLKIDRSFVANMTVSESDRAIVHAVISLAGSLNMAVIAEGAETEAQVQALRQLGCDLIQGYFCGYPLPPEKFAERLAGGPPAGAAGVSTDRPADPAHGAPRLP